MGERRCDTPVSLLFVAAIWVALLALRKAGV